MGGANVDQRLRQLARRRRGDKENRSDAFCLSLVNMLNPQRSLSEVPKMSAANQVERAVMVRCPVFNDAHCYLAALLAG